MSFSHRLMEACKAETVADVARKLQVPHPTARNYVHEGRLPSAEILLRIAAETNVSLDWLLLGEGPKDKSDLQPASRSFAGLFEPLDRNVIQEMADAGGITFEEMVGHLVREALAMKGIGEMPQMLPVPVFEMMSEDLERKVFQALDNLPDESTRQAETKRLIGALVTRAATP